MYSASTYTIVIGILKNVTSPKHCFKIRLYDYTSIKGSQHKEAVAEDRFLVPTPNRESAVPWIRHLHCVDAWPANKLLCDIFLILSKQSLSAISESDMMQLLVISSSYVNKNLLPLSLPIELNTRLSSSWIPTYYTTVWNQNKTLVWGVEAGRLKKGRRWLERKGLEKKSEQINSGMRQKKRFYQAARIWHWRSYSNK